MPISTAAPVFLPGLALLAALFLQPSRSWAEDASAWTDLQTAPLATEANAPPEATDWARRNDPAIPSCAGKLAPPRKAVSAITPSSFELDSGEVVAIAGVITRPPFATEDLDNMIRGKAVSLSSPEALADRWGRRPAQVFIHTGEPGTSISWLQSNLVSEGRALAYAAPGLQSCQTELLEHEAEAQRQRRGIWAIDPTLIRTADAREALAGDEGTFRIVTGRVRRVSESRGRIYLNFGQNWRQDFTALIPAEVSRSWPTPAPDFKSLRGRTVSVRGWVRNRNGPLIVIESPSMLVAP